VETTVARDAKERSAMKKLVVVALVTLGLALGATALTRAQAPENQILGRWAGTWKTDVVNKPAEGNPKETRTTGLITARPILGGTVVEEAGTATPGGVEYRALWGYDPQRQVYRSWFFDSLGTRTSHEGRWDEETSTMHWKADLGDGKTSEATHHFIDKDTYEWTLVVKDKAGKVYADARGKHTRVE
jgi:hypothetical protein